MYLTWANWGKNRDCGRSCMSAPGAVHSRALSPMHEQHGGGKELGKLPALRYQAHLPACVFCHKAVCHSEKCCVPSQPDALHWSHGSDGLVAGPGGLNDFMIWSQGSGGNFLSSPLENGKYWKNGMKKTLRSSVERNDNFLILVEMEDGRSASGTRQHFKEDSGTQVKCRRTWVHWAALVQGGNLWAHESKGRQSPAAHLLPKGRDGWGWAVQALGDGGAQCVRSVSSAEIPRMSSENSSYATDKALQPQQSQEHIADVSTTSEGEALSTAREKGSVWDSCSETQPDWDP